MSHSYYEEDSEQRKAYFQKLFLINTSKEDLKKIKNLNSFETALKRAWSSDPSLSSYLRGMSNSELLEFFERPAIQNILNKDIEKTIRNIPDKIVQVKKVNKQYFRGQIRGKPVFVYKVFVQVRGKKQLRYRDSKGRFARL